MKQIIMYRESLLQSVLSDLFTFGFLCVSFWFNYRFIGGSYFLNGVILVMMLMFIISKTGNKKHIFTSKEELKEYVESLEKDN